MRLKLAGHDRPACRITWCHRELLAFARSGIVENGSQSPFSLPSYMRSHCLDYRSAEGMAGNLREPADTRVVIIIKESPIFGPLVKQRVDISPAGFEPASAP